MKFLLVVMVLIAIAVGVGWTIRRNRQARPPLPPRTGPKLFSQEFYGMAASALTRSGRLVVQAGSPTFARQAFWCIDTTVAATGLHRVAYHVDVPSFGDWGFVLAGREEPVLGLPSPTPEGLRSLDAPALAAAAVFPPDRQRLDVDVSTLIRPRILDYERAGWQEY